MDSRDWKLSGRGNNIFFFLQLSALRLVFVSWHSAGVRALSLPTVQLPSALQICKSSQCDGEEHGNWMLINSFTVKPHTSHTDTFHHLYYLPTFLSLQLTTSKRNYSENMPFFSSPTTDTMFYQQYRKWLKLFCSAGCHLTAVWLPLCCLWSWGVKVCKVLRLRK